MVNTCVYYKEQCLCFFKWIVHVGRTSQKSLVSSSKNTGRYRSDQTMQTRDFYEFSKSWNLLAILDFPLIWNQKDLQFTVLINSWIRIFWWWQSCFGLLGFIINFGTNSLCPFYKFPVLVPWFLSLEIASVIISFKYLVIFFLQKELYKCESQLNLSFLSHCHFRHKGFPDYR